MHYSALDKKNSGDNLITSNFQHNNLRPKYNLRGIQQFCMI